MPSTSISSSLTSLNKVMLIGRLADKPRVEADEDGQKRIGLSVVTAMTTRLDVDTGERCSGEEWHRVVIFRPDVAAFAEAKLASDDRVYVEGRLRTSRWRDQTYQWRTLTQICIAEPGDQLSRLASGDPMTEDRPVDLCPFEREG